MKSVTLCITFLFLVVLILFLNGKAKAQNNLESLMQERQRIIQQMNRLEIEINRTQGAERRPLEQRIRNLEGRLNRINQEIESRQRGTPPGGQPGTPPGEQHGTPNGGHVAIIVAIIGALGIIIAAIIGLLKRSN